MAQWVCHNCKTKNDIDEERCTGSKCNKAKQPLDSIIGEKDD